ncbi:hypothetical protein B0H14DRAFT_3874716 [Mycena olivaceomarginata]|nr:hypothetical protein B0H14DRAFT_3874716 [Mycena olivaceomarginata]
MSLQWCPDDLDVDTPLLHLGRMSSPPTEILGLSSYDDLKDSTILGGVARHLPHIHSLQLENTGVFKEAAPEITTHLKKFTAMSVLEFGAVDDSTSNLPNNDRASVLLYGEACKSLTSITLMDDFGNGCLMIVSE